MPENEIQKVNPQDNITNDSRQTGEDFAEPDKQTENPDLSLNETSEEENLNDTSDADNTETDGEQNNETSEEGFNKNPEDETDDETDNQNTSIVLSDLNAVLTALKYVNRIIYDKLIKTGDIAIKLFNALGYEVTDELYLACYLANYGLLAVPENILLKQGYLSENEFREIKKHPQISAEVAKDVYLNALQDLYNDETAEVINQSVNFITNLILDHHELPPANPITKGYFNKMSVSKEAYILGIADKIVGATDKTRRLYSIIVPAPAAAREILSVFGETDAIFTSVEKQIIWDILLNENL